MIESQNQQQLFAKETRGNFKLMREETKVMREETKLMREEMKLMRLETQENFRLMRGGEAHARGEGVDESKD